MQSAGMAPDTNLRESFTRLAMEEQDHVATVEDILVILEKDT
jgi:rubrerythrin